MSAPAAIMGQLVDVRNVGTHKSVKLTVHVPAELAMQVLEAFGWATGVDPVPVAVARLTPQAQEEARKPAPTKPEPARASYAQTAGILCGDARFQTFLQERHPEIRLYNTGSTKDRTAEFVRVTCGVKSRADLLMGTPAGKRFTELLNEFRAWEMEPRVGQ